MDRCRSARCVAAVPLLTAALSDGHAETRRSAALALGTMRAAAAKAALAILRREPERVARLRHNGNRLLAGAQQAGINCGTSAGLAVVPAITGSCAGVVLLR